VASREGGLQVEGFCKEIADHSKGLVRRSPRKDFTSDSFMESPSFGPSWPPDTIHLVKGNVLMIKPRWSALVCGVVTVLILVLMWGLGVPNTSWGQRLDGVIGVERIDRLAFRLSFTVVADCGPSSACLYYSGSMVATMDFGDGTSEEFPFSWSFQRSGRPALIKQQTFFVTHVYANASACAPTGECSVRVTSQVAVTEFCRGGSNPDCSGPQVPRPGIGSASSLVLEWTAVQAVPSWHPAAFA
jgi:hypothetical protein